MNRKNKAKKANKERYQVFSKGGYEVDKNGVPRTSRGTNALQPIGRFR